MSSIGMFELCNIVRTKNAGPFFFTLDIVFRERAVYEAVIAQKLLTKEMLANAYGVPIEDVAVFETFDNVLAFKATFRRKKAAGGPGRKSVAVPTSARSTRVRLLRAVSHCLQCCR